MSILVGNDNEGVDLEVGELTVNVDSVETGYEVDEDVVNTLGDVLGERLAAISWLEGYSARSTGMRSFSALASTSPTSTPPSWVNRIQSPYQACLVSDAHTGGVCVPVRRRKIRVVGLVVGLVCRAPVARARWHPFVRGLPWAGRSQT